MKQCTRCGNKVNDQTTICDRCGNNKFRMIQALNQNTNMPPVPLNRQRNNTNANKNNQNRQSLNNTNRNNQVGYSGSGDYIDMKEWLITLIMLVIPVLNLVIMIKTILNKNGAEQETKVNFMKAYLIYYVIAVVLSIIITVVIGAMN